MKCEAEEEDSHEEQHKGTTGMDRGVRDIRERTFEYALRAIKVYRAVQKTKDGAGWIIAKQYLRSATSIGANVQEARSGESRADFMHKYGIAQKEARESLYWLRLLAASGVVNERRLVPLLQETEELIAIITRTILTTKRNTRT
jgi:four helix bundle protein